MADGAAAADPGQLAALLDRLKGSSGQERKAQIADLRSRLNGNTDGILTALRHGSGDVQRSALDAAFGQTYSAIDHAAVQAATLSALGRSSSNSSLSARQTSASALSVLCTLIGSHTVRYTSLEAQSIAKTLLVSLSSGLEGTAKPQHQVPTRRTAGPGQAFSFAQVSRRPSSSSLHSNTAESIASTCWESESAASGSESETNEEARRWTAAGRISRHRSIACLEALLSKPSRLLLTLWPAIACEGEPGQACLMDVVERDPVLSNRIAACRACETLFERGSASGAFASAEERPRNAFTSLSSRIALTIVHTRSRLVRTLNECNQSALIESGLRCLTVIVRSTTGAKLRQSHQESLRPTALRFCASKEGAVAIRAFGLLNAWKRDESSMTDDSLSTDILKRLEDDNLPAHVKAEAWSALGAARESTSEARQLALRHLRNGNDTLRQAVAAYVLTQKGVDMQEQVEMLCGDATASVRAAGADCLGHYSTHADHLNRMLSDGDPTVRAAAVRAVGVRIQAGIMPANDGFLALLQDGAYLVRNRASWTVGNLCEARPRIELLGQCLKVRNDDARVGAHAVRGLGAVLAACSADEVLAERAAALDSLRWMVSILRTAKDPKLRWNTGSTIDRIFRSGNGKAILGLIDDVDLVGLLAETLLNDRIFKVRLTACMALGSALEHVGLEDEDKARTLTVLQEAQAGLAVQTASASFQETQQHIIPLQTELARLLELLSSQVNHVV